MLIQVRLMKSSVTSTKYRYFCVYAQFGPNSKFVPSYEPELDAHGHNSTCFDPETFNVCFTLNTTKKVIKFLIFLAELTFFL